MNVYEGTDNYIFVSYAHNDSDKVMPILKALKCEGVRFWYDQGILAGTEWPDMIEKKLERSAGVIAFLSNRAAESRLFINELNYAIQLGRHIIVVYLEEINLSAGMQFQLSTYQAMQYYKYPSPSSFAARLKTIEIIQYCIGGGANNGEKSKIPVPKRPVKLTEYHQIFISYRRKGGDVVAKLICSELQNRGYSVFYDYDSLKGGYFDDHIVEAIKHCRDFILVLPRRALARCRNKKDWVRQEIICALEGKKNIIPVMVDGFEFPKKLPPEISDVARCNGVRFDMAYLDAVIDKIIEKFDR